MNIFAKKDNGINWQKEVFETSKAMPGLVKGFEDLNNGFKDHVSAGRKQRDEDKIWQEKLLKNSLECSEENRIKDLENEVKDLKTDKILKTGKILGMRLIYIIIIGVLGFITLALGILWRLGLLKFLS